MTDRNQQIVELLKTQQASIARTVVERQYALEPEVWDRYGQEGYQKSIRDVDYHLSYFYESLLAEDPSLFVDYLLWVKELFVGLNLPASVVETTLKIMHTVLVEALPGEFQPVLQPFFDEAAVRLTAADAEPSAALRRSSSRNKLMQQYVDALLHGERAAAGRLILDAVAQ